MLWSYMIDYIFVAFISIYNTNAIRHDYSKNSNSKSKSVDKSKQSSIFILLPNGDE